jgi:hypothetical protein
MGYVATVQQESEFLPAPTPPQECGERAVCCDCPVKIFALLGDIIPSLIIQLFIISLLW